MSDRPCASVVIPCLNEAAHIEACLDSLAIQNGVESGFEVLVVDGGSKDGTLEILKRRALADSGLRVLDNPDRITPVAMNMGIKEALADVVIILGAHAEVAPDFVRRNLEVLRAHPESGCVGGVVEQVHGDELSRRIGLALSSPFGVGDARFRTGGVAGHVDTVAFGAYRKSVLEELGGFDAALVRNQDDELNFRLTETGWRIWFDSRIRSTYHARSTYGQLFRQYPPIRFLESVREQETPDRDDLAPVGSCGNAARKRCIGRVVCPPLGDAKHRAASDACPSRFGHIVGHVGVGCAHRCSIGRKRH